MEYKQKILIVDPIQEQLLNFLKKNYDITIQQEINQKKILNIIEEFEILILRSGIRVDKTLLDRGKRIRLIIRAGTGTDNIDLKEVKSRGISFYNTPGTNSRSVAELSFGMMHCLYRDIQRANNEIKMNIWNKKSFQGFELSNKKIGLVGFGSIGKEIADIAEGYHMDIHCIVSTYSPERAEHLNKKNITLHHDLRKMCKQCDIIVVCCPYTTNTKQLLNKHVLSCLHKNAILINIARGGIVDEEALYILLEKKFFYGAASDVFIKEKSPSPLFNLKNFIGTPHIGAMSYESQKKIAISIINYLKIFNQL